VRSTAAPAKTCAEILQLLPTWHHSPYAAEIHLMAVKSDYRRHGIGRLMLRSIEERLAADRVEFLQVKTLRAARVDEGYAKTRSFWLACGFRPLEEFRTLWDPSTPALQLIKTVAPNSRRTRTPPGVAIARRSRTPARGAGSGHPERVERTVDAS
jgi:hypothetical protein